MEMGQLGPCMQLYAVFRIKIARSASVIGPAAGSVSTASATWWPYFPTVRREAKIWCLAVKIEDSSPKIWKVEEFGRMRKHDLHWLIMGIWRFSFFHFFPNKPTVESFNFYALLDPEAMTSDKATSRAPTSGTQRHRSHFYPPNHGRIQIIQDT